MDTKLVIFEMLAYIFYARELNINDAITDTVNTFYYVNLKHTDDLITTVGKIDHHHSNSDLSVVFVARNFKKKIRKILMLLLKLVRNVTWRKR